MELLTVIAIIATLVGLLLPAVQAARQAANERDNQINLTAIGTAMETYRSLNGHYPVSVALLSQSGLGQELLTGLSSGYQYSIASVTAVDFVAQGTPAAPGQTGVEQCTINHERFMRCGPTPGAGHNNSVMWTRLAARGAITVADIVLQFVPGVTPDEIRSHFALSSTVPSAFQQLDVNNNGQVGIADILQSRLPNVPDLNNEYAAFLGGVSQDMALGVANEHVNNLPGVRIFQLSSERLCDGNQPSPCVIFPEPPQSH